MKIKYLVDEGGFAPEKAHDTDAGFDLRTPIDFAMRDGKPITIDTKLHVMIPKGYVGFIKSKSGLHVHYGITADGVVDAGYTGSIRVTLTMLKEAAPFYHNFKRGDKITQMVILPIPEVEMEETDTLEETERGANGFGSTGK